MNYQRAYPIALFFLFSLFVYGQQEPQYKAYEAKLNDELSKLSAEIASLRTTSKQVEQDKQELSVIMEDLQKRTASVERIVENSVHSPEASALLKDTHDFADRLLPQQIAPLKGRTQKSAEKYGVEYRVTTPPLTEELTSTMTPEQLLNAQKLTNDREALIETYETHRDDTLADIQKAQAYLNTIQVQTKKLSEITLANMLWQRNEKPLWEVFTADQTIQEGVSSRLNTFKSLSFSSLEPVALVKLVASLAIIPLMVGGLVLLLRTMSKRLTENWISHTLSRSLLFLLPAYLLYTVGSRMNTFLTPVDLGTETGKFCQQIAIVLGIIMLTRSILSTKSKVIEELNLPDEMLKWINGVVLKVSILYAALVLTPSYLCSNLPSLKPVTLPLELLFTVLFIGVVCVKALSKREAFAQYMCRKNEFLERNWDVLRTLVMLMFAATLMLGVLGYITAWNTVQTALITSMALTVAITVIYPHLRLLALRAASKLIVSWDSAVQEEMTDEEVSQRIAAEKRMRIDRTKTFVDNTFVVLFLIALYSVWNSSGLLSSALSKVELFSWKSGDSMIPLTLQGTIMGIGVIIIFTLLTRSLPSFFELFVFPRFRVDPGISYTVISISRYLLMAVGILIALSYMQVDLSKIGWLVAALGVGLGFGLQEIVSNFICGLILLIERPVRVGDVVTIDGVSGTVTRINIRSTTVTDWDKLENVIPNKNFITQKLTNWSLTNKLTRIIIPIGVAYGTDPDRVKQILIDVAKSDNRVLSDPAPMALFRSHGESSLDFELRVYLSDFKERIWVEDTLVTALNRAMNRENIEMPFPQRDLHIISGDLPKQESGS